MRFVENTGRTHQGATPLDVIDSIRSRSFGPGEREDRRVYMAALEERLAKLGLIYVARAEDDMARAGAILVAMVAKGLLTREE